ncbi:MAG: hypothetical protein FWD34_00030 [Oscillospiraceae bacterium]|nr:hypothetical protein [Oscillospiraceae bacterium]
MLKRSFILLLVFSLILISACSGVTRINPDSLKLNKAYEFTVNMSKGEFNTVARFARKNADIWEITLLEPFALEGISLTYNKGVVSADFDGVTANSEKIQPNAVYAIVISALENAFCGEGREIVSAGEIITITGSTGTYAYTLTLDKKTLQPLELKMPDASLTAAFSQTITSDIIEVVIVGDAYDIYEVEEDIVMN